MKVDLSKSRTKETEMMRDVLCNTLIELADTDKRVCYLDADLMGSSNAKPFANAHPDRCINCGIQEANMIGVAAGMSITGMIPYCHSFAPFIARRAFDQIFISGAYAKANIRLIASDPGVTAGFNGGTHMPFEDAAPMLAIPEITVIEPVDTVMLKKLIVMTNEMYGIFYFRMMRKNAISIYDSATEFEIGRGLTLREGNDLTIFATGIMVDEALKAAEQLASRDIDACVVNLFTWKPIDTELIGRCASKTRAVVTAENHNVYNGFGNAVCKALSATCPVPVEMVGIQDLFGEVGPEDYLRERFNLTANDIVAAAERVLKRKSK